MILPLSSLINIGKLKYLHLLINGYINANFMILYLEYLITFLASFTFYCPAFSLSFSHVCTSQFPCSSVLPVMTRPHVTVGSLLLSTHLVDSLYGQLKNPRVNLTEETESLSITLL